MGFIKGLLWFLINIPLLGIPYLLSRNKVGSKKTDNTDPRYSIHIQVPLFVSRKDIQRVCDDIGLSPGDAYKLLGNRGGIRAMFDSNNAVKVSRYTRDGLLGCGGIVVDEERDDYVDLLDMETYVKNNG